MAAQDIYPPLQVSTNSIPLHPNFHQRNLYITLPASNSIDNRNSLSTSTDLVILDHSTGLQPQPSSITNVCQNGLNRDTQSNVTAVVQQQQSYQHTQGPQETSSDSISSSLNDTNQTAASASTMAVAASTLQSNLGNSTCNTNNENESNNLSVQS